MVIYILVVPLSLLYHLSVQRLGNPKMSVVYHSVPSDMQHCTPRQFQDLLIHPSLPYITTDFTYIKILANLLQEMLFIKYKMENTIDSKCK